MATLTSSAPSPLSLLAAPLRGLNEAFAMLRAAQRAAVMADDLYRKSDEALAARGLTREDVSKVILRELDQH